ncbi:MAG: hypothetical protein ACLTSG_12475 [Lachnospiraceae bacterium]
MKDIILLKQGETVLKGLNRRYFEQKLVSNIRKRLKPMGEFRVYCVQSTVYVEPESETLRTWTPPLSALSKRPSASWRSRAPRPARRTRTPSQGSPSSTCARTRWKTPPSFKVETEALRTKSFHLTSVQLSPVRRPACWQRHTTRRRSVDVRHRGARRAP